MPVALVAAARHARRVRIAYLARPESGNGFYRGIGPMTALAKYRGHHVRALPIENDAPQPAGPLDDIDVLHIHRYCEDRTWRLARDAKANGAAVVWDNDDNLATMPKGVAHQRHWGGFAGERRLTSMRRMWRLVDLVTTPSDHLAGLLLQDGAPRTEVLPNYLPDSCLNPDRRPHPRVTIGWTAALEHAADVERMPILPALQRLLDERDDVNVISLGLRLGLRSERYFHIPYVPLLALTQQIVEFDVGIAPLSDIEFNRARSDVKLKEYAAAGVPWLASPIGPYAGLGEKQGGRLVADGDWHEQLTRLIERPKERRKLAKRGAKWVAGQTLSKHARAWEDALSSAVASARASATAA
jgi:glycosyltransferase involved in cell wall biosynthesis